jgi:uncharacterized protein (TIGR02466 family)
MFNTLLFGIGISTFHFDNIDNNSLSEIIRVKKSIDVRDFSLDDSKLLSLNNVVLSECQKILDNIAKEKKAEIKKIWCNHGINKDIEEPHNHRNSFLSAVYYPLSTDGVIQFFSPFSDYFLSHVPLNCVENLDCYTASFYNLPVKTGDLIIFNSMLYHRAKLSTNERISIAYDISIR